MRPLIFMVKIKKTRQIKLYWYVCCKLLQELNSLTSHWFLYDFYFLLCIQLIYRWSLPLYMDFVRMNPRTWQLPVPAPRTEYIFIKIYMMTNFYPKSLFCEFFNQCKLKIQFIFEDQGLLFRAIQVYNFITCVLRLVTYSKCCKAKALTFTGFHRSLQLGDLMYHMFCSWAAGTFHSLFNDKQVEHLIV